MHQALAASFPEALPEGARCAAHVDEGASFLCTRCGTYGCPTCLFSAVPTREVCRACAQKGLGEPIPWERRKAIGNWRAYWQTVRLASRSPTAFFRTPTTQPSVLGALAHGALTYTVSMVLTYLVLGLLFIASGGAVAVFGDGDMSNVVGGILGFYGVLFIGMSPFALLFAPASGLFGIAIAAAGSHGTLALFKKTGARFEDTLRAVSYATSPTVWTFVPIVGSFAYFWMLGVEVVAIRETHGCGKDWAVLAVLGYRALFVMLLVGFYVAIIAAAFYFDQPVYMPTAALGASS